MTAFSSPAPSLIDTAIGRSRSPATASVVRSLCTPATSLISKSSPSTRSYHPLSLSNSRRASALLHLYSEQQLIMPALAWSACNTARRRSMCSTLDQCTCLSSRMLTRLLLTYSPSSFSDYGCAPFPARESHSSITSSHFAEAAAPQSGQRRLSVVESVALAGEELASAVENFLFNGQRR